MTQTLYLRRGATKRIGTHSCERVRNPCDLHALPAARFSGVNVMPTAHTNADCDDFPFTLNSMSARSSLGDG